MVKKLSLNSIRNKFKEEGIYIFTPFDLQKFFNVSANTASLFLTRNVKNNNLFKIRSGMYAFHGDYLGSFLIANKVYMPSYISFEYALAFYSVIPEVVYAVTSATTRITREFDVNNIIYSYQHIKKRAFIGYIKKDFNGQTSLIAEPEKALADYFYFVDLKKISLNDRLELKGIKKNKLLSFMRLFKRRSLLKLVEQIYAEQRKPRKIY